MEHLILIGFGVFLLALILLDVVMIVSLLKPGDERKQLIVWKASTFAFFIAVSTLVMDIVEPLLNPEATAVSPFIKLSVIAMFYCASLLYFKKKHGD